MSISPAAERGDRGRLVGDVLEDDAIDVHDLAAGMPAGGSERGT